MNSEIFWDAVTTVIQGRVKQVSESFFSVGDEVTVKLEIIDNIPRISSCSCRQHSVRDIHIRGYCSATLAVLFHKMLRIYNSIKK